MPLQYNYHSLSRNFCILSFNRQSFLMLKISRIWLFLFQLLFRWEISWDLWQVIPLTSISLLAYILLVVVHWLKTFWKLLVLKLQEYVDHSSTLYKFYVLGEKIFYAVKKSTPNINALINLHQGVGPLVFDRLHFCSITSFCRPIIHLRIIK